LPRFLRLLEVRTLALLATVGAAVWGFLALSDEIGENATAHIDRSIILAMRVPGHPSDPIGSRSFEEAMRDVTALGGFTVLTLVTVVAAATLIYFKRWRQALVFVATIRFFAWCNWSAFTSGTTSGQSGSIRQALELSTT